MALDGLAVAIGSRTADVTAGLAEVRQSLGRVERSAASAGGGLNYAGEQLDDTRNSSLSLSAALTLLSGRADEAGDNIMQAGRRAAMTSGLFTALTASSDGLSLSVGTLSTVMTASLLPAIAVLSTALAPLVAALGGFAAIAGSIVGIGLAGALGAAATHTQQLKSTWTTMTSMLRQEFAPALKLAATVLDSLMVSFMGIIPALAPAKGELVELASLFEQVGRAVITSLPAFVDLGFVLAREFLPPLVEMTRAVLPRLPGIVRELVASFREVRPVLMPLVGALVEMAPVLLEFGTNVLKLVVPALTALADVGTGVMRFVNRLGRTARDAVTGLAVLAPAIYPVARGFQMLFSAVGSGGALTTLRAIGMRLAALAGPIGIVVSAIGLLATAISTNFGGAATSLQNAVSRIGSHLRGLQPVLRGFAQFWRTLVAPAIHTVASVISETLSPAVAVLETVFGAVFDGILGTVTGTIKSIVAVMRAGARLFAGDWQGALRILATSFKSTLVGILQYVFKWQNRLVEVITQAVTSAVNGVSGALNNLPGIQMGDVSAQQIQKTVGQASPAGTQSKQERIIREIKEVRILPSDQFKVEQRRQTKNVLKEEAERAERGAGGGS